MGLTSQLNRKYRALIAIKQYPICYLCGQPIKKQNEVSQDHLICKSAGGITSPENLSVAHKICNNKRGCLTVQEWFDRQRQLNYGCR